VDVTNDGMGRNPAYVANVEKETGITIVHSTGFYKEPFLPERVYGQTVQEMADWMIGEIRGGIDGGVKPGMIGEIGTSKNTMTETEKKVFDASVIAAKETGLPIYTHTTLGTYAPEQAAYFKATGLPMDRIVLGHIDLSGDLDYIRRVLDYGVTIGFDTVGKNNYFPDAKRVEYLLALESEGRLDQIVLSEDLTRKSHLKHKGGIGYCYLFETFIPMLKEAGFKQESLDTMLIHNPARILGV
jgi:phosphotriesterase-related protein